MDEETKQLIIGMAKDIGTLKSDVGSLKSDVGSLKSDVGSLKSDVGSLAFRIDSIQFDLNCFREETDVNFSLVHDESGRLEEHIDGFAKQSIRFDTENAATRSRQDRMEERLDRLERKIR